MIIPIALGLGVVGLLLLSRKGAGGASGAALPPAPSRQPITPRPAPRPAPAPGPGPNGGGGDGGGGSGVRPDYQQVETSGLRGVGAQAGTYAYGRPSAYYGYPLRYGVVPYRQRR